MATQWSDFGTGITTEVWTLLAVFSQIYNKNEEQRGAKQRKLESSAWAEEPVSNFSGRVWLLTPRHMVLRAPERQASVCRDTTGTETRNKQGTSVSENFQDRRLS